MTTIVSDTSPINYLVLIREIGVLPELFDQVLVPPAVLAELQHHKAPPPVSNWLAQLPTWVQVKAPSKLAHGLGLDAGETEALSLAIELNIPAILIDEKQGRLAAERRNIIPVGTLNVLDLADRRGLLDLEVAISRLRATSFHVSEAIIRELLERAKARKSGHSG